MRRRQGVLAAVLVLAVAPAPSRAEIPCFDVENCSPYYAWLATNVLLATVEPKQRVNLTKYNLGLYNLSESVNNIDSYQKCRYEKETDPQGRQDLEYCVYTVKSTPDAIGQIFTETTCESEVQYGHCLKDSAFYISDLLQFYNSSATIDAYLLRCPPPAGKRNNTIGKLQNISKGVMALASNPQTAGLIGLAVERECGQHTQAADRPGPVIMIIISVVLGLLGASSELLEYLAKLKSRQAEDRSITSKPEEMPLIAVTDATGMAAQCNQKSSLKIFNLSANFGELFSSSGARSIGGLDGLKGFSMLWIILAHASLFSTFVGTLNPARAKDFLQQTNTYFAFSATFGVDTFFFVSGLLTSYVMVKKLRKMRGGAAVKTGRFFIFVALRWLRLTPLYAYVMFMYTYVATVSADGPFWYKMVAETDHCRKFWWSNLLYINNFFPSEYHNQCMAWSWYLANDLQFYIIALIILFLYLQSPKLGAGLASLVVITCTVVGYIITVRDNLGDNSGAYQNEYYDKPYMRITPYAFGLLVGMMYRDTSVNRLRLSTPAAFVAQTLCVGTIVFIFYIQATRYDQKSGYDVTLAPLKETWSKYDYAAFNSFGRLAFVCALAGMCTLNVSGNGGIVYSFLTLPFWEPMGKLTFGAYLIHPVILRIYYYSQVQLYYFSHINQATVFVAAATLGYGFSMFTYVLIESPSQALITKMMGGGRRK